MYYIWIIKKIQFTSKEIKKISEREKRHIFFLIKYLIYKRSLQKN